MMQKGAAKLRVAAMLVLGTVGLSACATQEYVDHRIAEVNEHITAVEAKANDAGQKADAAMSAAQAAQAAAAQANQRIDQLNSQVTILQQQQQQPPPQPLRTPRG